MFLETFLCLRLLCDDNCYKMRRLTNRKDSLRECNVCVSHFSRFPGHAVNTSGVRPLMYSSES